MFNLFAKNNMSLEEKEELKEKKRIEKEEKRQALYERIEKEKEERKQKDELQKIRDSKYTKIAGNFSNSFYYSHELQCIKIGKKEYSYKDILKFEPYVYECTETKTTSQTKTKSSPSIGKAVVGGALFGPAGAIIGGVSGKSTSNTIYNTENIEYCNSIGVIFTLNDLNNPLVDYKLLTYKVKKADSIYLTYINQLNKLKSILEIELIK